MSILDKTLGKNKIPNYILKSIIDLIFLYLDVIFNACLMVGYCYIYFRFSIIIVFQKPKKQDYTITKTYCLIIFFNTIKKALKFIIAKHIIYLTKTHNLLSHNYFGIRRLSFIKHTLY